MAVVVTGSVSVFTTAVRLELRSAVASAAGVDVSAVRLDVAALARLRELRRELQGSSVSLTFTIVTTATAAAATANTLSSRLANPTAASAFLTTSSYTASVTSILSLPVAIYVSPPSPPTPTESIVGTIVVAVVVPIGLCFLFVVGYYYYRLRCGDHAKDDPAYTPARRITPAKSARAVA